MKSTLIAKYTSLLTAGLWAAKAVAIGLAGGLDRSPAEGPLFLAGLASCIVAIVALALTLTAGRSLLLRIGSVVVGVVAAFAVTTGLNVLIQLLANSDHWVWSELNLWVLAIAVLALAWRTPARAEVVAMRTAPGLAD